MSLVSAENILRLYGTCRNSPPLSCFHVLSSAPGFQALMCQIKLGEGETLEISLLGCCQAARVAPQFLGHYKTISPVFKKKTNRMACFWVLLLSLVDVYILL